ncbi:S1-like domain-containing RNA-binding protein [Echinicola jeungdonensis]|uniref:S1 RNA-binding domain-containing protein n=1 Tax=Echinicola jeungdonensis TaxID=709343 RepID=A0ABV5J7H5_9BACT|nr:S1-like domain-containing RNA-binding protein [Echinicola jeungdonensis]MDN3670915.1 S1-like domain-containing RNA-binding protein [Echinicola jeungdonensis]
MKELGRISTLSINRFTANGAYLQLSNGNEVLLPKSYLQGDEQEGDEKTVFIYTDSEDRPVAITQKPIALVDEFALMRAKTITSFGAFMDWGLPKDLFVPKSEMGKPIQAEEKYLVMVCVDYKTNRLIGVSKYQDFILSDTENFSEGQEVEILVFEKTELGFKVLIDGNYEGLIYENEIFEPLQVGDKKRAYIKKKREDGKLDVQLNPIGRQKYEEGAEKILETLKVQKFLPLHDKSSPEEIKKTLGMSKKHFKQSIGQLYKSKRILLHKDGIELID